jgi:DNA-binding NarL/FixJ family response regulator
MSTHTILFIDTNPHFLRAATHLFQQYYTDELKIVGAIDGTTDEQDGNDGILHQVHITRPRIILLDLDKHYLESLYLISRLRAELPEVGVIALSSHTLYDYQYAALNAGAHAFVAKDDLNHALLPAVWRITGTPSSLRRSVGEPEHRHDTHPTLHTEQQEL